MSEEIAKSNFDKLDKLRRRRLSKDEIKEAYQNAKTKMKAKGKELSK